MQDYSDQAMTVLNHAGVCLSYDATLIHMKKMVDKEDYITQVRQGRWLWVYDNFNIHQAIRHERKGIFVFQTYRVYTTSFSCLF